MSGGSGVKVPASPDELEPREADKTKPDVEVEAAGWSVHEWGLLAMQQGDGGHTLTLAAGAPTTRGQPDVRNMLPAKPVIYVHLPEDSNPMDLTVQVDLVEGEFMETFPVASARAEPATSNQRGRQRVLWQATAEPGSCSRSGLDAYPAQGSTTCTAVRDGYCEASELANYETRDSACLKVDGLSYNHLFYRGDVREVLGEDATAEDIGLGLRVTSQSNGEVVLSNRSGGDGQGRVYRVSRAADGSLRASQAPFPKNGEDAHLPRPTVLEEDLPKALHALLIENGLTEPEALAFEAAWSTTLTSVDKQTRSPADTAPPLRLQPAPDALWFLIPPPRSR